MSLWTSRDFVGGGALIGLGLFVSAYSYQTMPLGTISRMGPGLMPFSLGWLLTGFGAIIAAGSIANRVQIEKFEWRNFLCVVGAIIVFSLVARPLGMAPAVACVLVLASLAELKMTKVQFLALLVALPTLCYLAFSVGLGVPLPLFKWPF
ncbi:hypothetical protein GCM10011385_37400 [Nitratireductor aestuarii]|uniref:DUF1468 domain-containing protein n=1 Tax=Nitratireductor aestuarii TaxID=1735103 RepID=A0A916S205_9HYPH|nr:tripartite tricarboxylate transporter TctB family protein [Nitratireductor aestuarii]GGA79700.1 hypothetical protein GCM10011385_37400 [Nitratireductor aestuarii]